MEARQLSLLSSRFEEIKPLLASNKEGEKSNQLSRVI